MRISVVVRNGILGQEPIAAFKYFDDADEFCSDSDIDYSANGDSAKLGIINLTLDMHLGGTLEDVGDPELLIPESQNYNDDDDDEDY